MITFKKIKFDTTEIKDTKVIASKCLSTNIIQCISDAMKKNFMR